MTKKNESLLLLLALGGAVVLMSQKKKRGSVYVDPVQKIPPYNPGQSAVLNSGAKRIIDPSETHAPDMTLDGMGRLRFRDAKRFLNPLAPLKFLNPAWIVKHRPKGLFVFKRGRMYMKLGRKWRFIPGLHPGMIPLATIIKR